jgi:hypothetical protein
MHTPLNALLQAWADNTDHKQSQADDATLHLV